MEDSVHSYDNMLRMEGGHVMGRVLDIEVEGQRVKRTWKKQIEGGKKVSLKWKKQLADQSGMSALNRLPQS